MLDCITIHIKAFRVDYDKLGSDRPGEWSTSIREQVRAARERQRIRFDGTKAIYNSDMCVAKMVLFCKIDKVGEPGASGQEPVSVLFAKKLSISFGGSRLFTAGDR